MKNIQDDRTRANRMSENSIERQVWVKPSFERLALKDALNTHANPAKNDASTSYS